MEQLYRGVETSLLVLSLGLVLLAVTAFPVVQPDEATVAVTLPMISVTAER